jgi:hypothetical protein
VVINIAKFSAELTLEELLLLVAAIAAALHLSTK